MGWWSATIMGGDTPLDFVGTFHDILKLKYDSGKNKFTKKNMEAGIDKLVAYLMTKKNSHWYCDEKNVGFQVLGVQMMECGARMSPELKEKIIQACDEDRWAHSNNSDNDDRKKIIDSFRTAILNYSGKKAKTPYESVFEKMATKSGLVNTNI